jgi:cellulose biosynthesis protein BcsQ
MPEPLGVLNGLMLEATEWARAGSSASSATAAVGLRPVEPLLEASKRAPLPTSALRGTPPTKGARSGTRSAAVTAGPGRVVAIVSPKGGCGKTTVSLNLALSLARQGRSVVLVDADVNGDVLSSIDARSRATSGAFDVLLGHASVDGALMKTVLTNFQILPAVGTPLPPAEQLARDHSAAWRKLLTDLARRAEVVLVDTPAGMFGVTHQVISSASHVIGVLQAEQIAARSFERFSEGLEAVLPERRPTVAGIVVNMLQTRQDASMSVFQSACQDLPVEWLFDTSIPRHAAFLDATHAGVPLRHLDDQAPPAIAWLFDNLAAEVTSRIALGSTGIGKPRSLLS